MPKLTGVDIFQETETLLWIKSQNFKKRFSQLPQSHQDLYNNLANLQAAAADKETQNPPSSPPASTLSKKPPAKITAYKLYAKGARAKLKDLNMDRKDATSKIRRHWKKLSPEKKQKWEQRALEQTSK